MASIISICIPTFNRCECLKECLRSVLDSVSGHEIDVDIVISNNASTDGTEEVVKSFKELHPWIRYHRNETNIGAEMNIYSVAAMGKGEYIWVFGDDDKMENGAIRRVLDHIKSGFDLLVCNYSVWDKSFNLKKRNDGLRFGQDQIYYNFNEFLKRFNLHLGYISSVVVRRKLFFKLTYDEYMAFINNGFSFMYAVYVGMAHHNTCGVYISIPVVCNRSGNSGDYDWCKYMVIGSSSVFDALIDKGYSVHSVSFAKRKVFTDFILPNLLYIKLRDDYNLIGVLRLMFQYYKGDWLFWLVCVPAMLVPVSLIRLARGVARIVIRTKLPGRRGKIVEPTNGN